LVLFVSTLSCFLSFLRVYRFFLLYCISFLSSLFVNVLYSFYRCLRVRGARVFPGLRVFSRRDPLGHQTLNTRTVKCARSPRALALCSCFILSYCDIYLVSIVVFVDCPDFVRCLVLRAFSGCYVIIAKIMFLYLQISESYMF
jgi:hypothetical protein